jgi:hypothetical protein
MGLPMCFSTIMSRLPLPSRLLVSRLGGGTRRRNTLVWALYPHDHIQRDIPLHPPRTRSSDEDQKVRILSEDIRPQPVRQRYDSAIRLPERDEMCVDAQSLEGMDERLRGQWREDHLGPGEAGRGSTGRGGGVEETSCGDLALEAGNKGVMFLWRRGACPTCVSELRRRLRRPQYNAARA